MGLERPNQRYTHTSGGAEHEINSKGDTCYHKEWLQLRLKMLPNGTYSVLTQLNNALAFS